MPRGSQHWQLSPPALKKFFDSNLYFKGFQEVNKIIARTATARARVG